MSRHEELPRWLAWPMASSAPTEGQVTIEKCRALLQSYLEFAVLVILADARERSANVSAGAEATMRYAMTRRMRYAEWAAVFQKLAIESRGETLLGVDVTAAQPSGSAVHRACQALGCKPTVLELAQAVDPARQATPTAGRDIRAATEELLAASPILGAYPLRYIVSVRPVEEAFEVRYLELVGTAFVNTQTSRVWRQPDVSEGNLVFWSDARTVAIPNWFAQYDVDTRVLWVLNGRVGSREWELKSRNPAVPPRIVSSMPEGLPVFLGEDDWDQEVDPFDDGFDDDGAGEGRDTSVLSALDYRPKLAHLLETDTLEDEHTAEINVFLVMYGGANFLEYIPLEPGTVITLGRDPRHSSFVIEHSQVSRRNSRVEVGKRGEITVNDEGSTNGTRVNGQAVGREPSPLRPADDVEFGPVSARVEPLSPGRQARIDRVLELTRLEGRDPLTGMLDPTLLAKSLGLTDKRFGQRTVTGIFLYLDGLSAVHASAGRQSADILFRGTSRLVMVDLDEQTPCARVGYGECLIALRETRQSAAEQVARRLLETIHRSPLANHIKVVAGVLEAKQGEDLDDWVQKIRELTLRRSGSSWSVVGPDAS